VTLYLKCWGPFWAPEYKRNMDRETGLSVAKDSENDEGAGACLLSEKAERAGTVQPGEGSGGSYQTPHKDSKECRDRIFSSGAH